MDNNNNQGGKFANGFLLGLLIGGALVFLLGTKKGKRLLKAISEKGIGNISNILEEADRTADLDEMYEEDEEVAPKRTIAVKEKSTEEKPRVRRFFRGISRHVN